MDVSKKNLVILLSNSYDLFFDEENDDEDRLELIETGSNVVVKVKDYAETVIPRQTDDQFQTHFRLQRVTFMFLVEKLSVKLGHFKTLKPGPAPIDPEKQLLVAIWTLANQESYRYWHQIICQFTLPLCLTPSVIR